MRLNRKEVADVFGCSLPTVDVWVNEGLPAVQQGSRGVEWVFDSVAVHQWLVKKAKASRRGRGNRFGEGDEPEGVISRDEADRRKAVAQAKSAELSLAEEMKLVAPIAALSKVISNEIANARARILAIPTKFRPAAQMGAKNEEAAKKLVSEVDDLVRDALTEIKVGSGAE